MRLTLGRDAFLEQRVGESNVYKEMKKVLLEISKKYWIHIKDHIDNIRIRSGNERLDEVFELIEDAYQEGKPLNIKRRTAPIGPKNPVVDPESKDDEIEENDEIEEDDKRDRRRRLPYRPIKQEFELYEGELRSKSSTGVDGNRIIVINSSHPDYLESTKSPIEERTYLAKVITSRIPECELLDAIDRGKKFGDKEIPVRLVNRADELQFSLEKILKSPIGRKTIRKGRKRK